MGVTWNGGGWEMGVRVWVCGSIVRVCWVGVWGEWGGLGQGDAVEDVLRDEE